MKKLQNDFTTPEQSKRLLKLGLPQDSANMILDGYIDSANRWVPDPYPRYLEHPYSVEIKNESELYTSNVLPCWSAGRLIEIWNICANLMPGMDLEFSPSSNSYIEDLVRDFEFAGEDSLIDFSKLED